MSKVTVFLVPDAHRVEFFRAGEKTQVEAMQKLWGARAYIALQSIELSHTGEDAAEEMFDLSNNPARSGDRHVVACNRSLSVGDVVQVDNDRFLCLSTGWHRF